MLQYIKKYIRGWLLAIVLFFIFISFAFWGVGDIFRKNDTNVANVGKLKISRNLFLTEFQLAMNEFNKNLSDKEISQNDRINLAKQSLSKLTTRYLFLNLANEMNLKISQNVIKESILNNELFHIKGQNNKFDNVLYKNFVNSNFGSEINYINFLKEEKVIELFYNNLGILENYPNNFSKKLYNYLEEKKEFEIGSIDKIYEQRKIKKPDKKILEKLFNENKEKYQFEERRSFSYIHINSETLIKDINVSEDEILELYNERIDDFVIPEKRKIQQIIFNTNENANRAYDLLNKKIKFVDIPKEMNIEDLEVATLDFLEKKQLLNDFADDVFLLEKNTFTKPIKTPVGWHLIKVLEINEKKTKDINLVKNELKKDIAYDKSFDEMDIVINEIEKNLSNNLSLEDISKKINIKLNNSELIDKRSFLNKNNKDLPKIFSNKLFYQNVFNKKIDDDLFIEEIENGFFITRIDKIVGKTQMNFDEAYVQVFRKWSKIEANKNIKKRIQEFKKEIEKNDNFLDVCDLLNFDSRTTKFINRDKLIEQGFSENFANNLFKANLNDVLEEEDEQIYYIVKVISDKKNDFDKKKYQEIKKTLDKTFANNNLEQLVYMLEKKYPIKINNNFINSFIKTLE